MIMPSQLGHWCLPLLLLCCMGRLPFVGVKCGSIGGGIINFGKYMNLVNYLAKQTRRNTDYLSTVQVYFLTNENIYKI